MKRQTLIFTALTAAFAFLMSLPWLVPHMGWLALIGLLPLLIMERLATEKTRLVLEEIVKQEQIEISEDAIDAEIKKMAETYKIEPEKMKEFMSDADKESMAMDLKVQEAVDFLVAEAVLTDPAPKAEA